MRELWHRIVPRLEQLGFTGTPEQPGLTLVFDREGSTAELFQQLAAKGLAVVTWIKGPQAERWPQNEFRPARIPVTTPTGSTVLEGAIAERELDPAPGLTVREIRFRADRRLRGVGKNGQPRQLSGQPGPDQRQAALLTTHPDLTAEQAAGLLRSRWT